MCIWRCKKILQKIFWPFCVRGGGLKFAKYKVHIFYRCYRPICYCGRPTEAYRVGYPVLSRHTHKQCEKKNPPWGLVAFFPKRLGIFSPNFTWLLRVPVYARLQILIQLSATSTKLWHFKRDHPVHVHHRPKRTMAFSDIFPKRLGVQILHTY